MGFVYLLERLGNGLEGPRETLGKPREKTWERSWRTSVGNDLGTSWRSREMTWERFWRPRGIALEKLWLMQCY
ncbi:unnamed protein product [Rhizophagus irregularis]|nr:unnamed protein product [Rhizophagus irregularis]